MTIKTTLPKMSRKNLPLAGELRNYLWKGGSWHLVLFSSSLTQVVNQTSKSFNLRGIEMKCPV
jgi:hypothetical protein